MLVRSTLKWTVILASLMAVGPVAGRLIGSLRGPGGIADTTPLLSVPLASGLASAGAAYALAAAAGLFAARFFGSRAGMTCAGLVLAWAAWAAGTVDAIVAPLRAAGEARPMLVQLAVEGAGLGLLGLALAAGILRAGASADAALLMEKDKRSTPAADDHRDFGAVLISGLVAAAMGGLAAWWIAYQPLKGQIVFAGLAGGIAAAAAAHLSAPHLPARIGALTAFGAMALLAAVGPLTALVVGAPVSARSVAAGAASHLAFLTGFDWAAGAFLGIPIGLGWSGSMVEKHSPGPTSAAPARA